MEKLLDTHPRQVILFISLFQQSLTHTNAPTKIRKYINYCVSISTEIVTYYSKVERKISYCLRAALAWSLRLWKPHFHDNITTKEMHITFIFSHFVHFFLMDIALLYSKVSICKWRAVKHLRIFSSRKVIFIGVIINKQTKDRKKKIMRKNSFHPSRTSIEEEFQNNSK